MSQSPNYQIRPSDPTPTAPAQQRTCLSYWFPKLVGLPVPKTEIVRWPGAMWDLADWIDGKLPVGFLAFVEQLVGAAEKVLPYPVFMRTGMGSGKHDWKNCCFVPDAKSIGQHVLNLIEWSHLVDMMGLPHHVWVLREMLPVEPLAICTLYGDFPLVREVRCFIADGKIQCWHPYWPTSAIRDGGVVDSEEIAAKAQDIKLEEFEWLAWRVARAFKDDGAWSVDLLCTQRGWYVTDMAEAHASFHWEGCPNGRR